MRYQTIQRDDEDVITSRIIDLASKYGRYGYRRITALLQREGYDINHKRVERIWREQGLKVPSKQPKRKRLWPNDGSCIRLRPLHKNHVWSYDFVYDQLENGKRLRWLNLIDEYTKQCVYSSPRYQWNHKDIIEVLADCFIQYGTPEYIRSDNGPEFIAQGLRTWLEGLEIQTTFIEPGSPWENGYCESFNGKMRDEFLNLELFSTLQEARALTNLWIKHYNQFRPHSALKYKSPAPESIVIKST